MAHYPLAVPRVLDISAREIGPRSRVLAGRGMGLIWIGMVTGSGASRTEGDKEEASGHKTRAMMEHYNHELPRVEPADD